MRRLTAVAAGLWLGLHIGFGYIAAPILFARLDKITAGNIAGSLFHYVNGLGLVVWLAAYFICRNDSRRNRYAPQKTHRLVAFLLFLTAFNEFLMTPVIEALKTGQNNWLHSWIGGSFGMWHDISSLIYMLASLVGLILCFMLLRLREAVRY
ncbi:MAG: DUF4149 domain-containing protein [Alysiella sp.]|uniref:DUF4149 domain-containing protein n=1 Tax=Alysiella sp. TaxID=1872483 RepID=UPI0026DBD8F9|nr:DUF4149 domain-containing protein [Alysiella sp.]MDO4434181.1 DUF4149 domain-containing protein [Alysiella sp.]